MSTQTQPDYQYFDIFMRHYIELNHPNPITGIEKYAESFINLSINEMRQFMPCQSDIVDPYIVLMRLSKLKTIESELQKSFISNNSELRKELEYKSDNDLIVEAIKSNKIEAIHK